MTDTRWMQILVALLCVAALAACASSRRDPECPWQVSACDTRYLSEIRTATGTDTAIGHVDQHYVGYGHSEFYYRRRADSTYVHVVGDVAIREFYP